MGNLFPAPDYPYNSINNIRWVERRPWPTALWTRIKNPRILPKQLKISLLIEDINSIKLLGAKQIGHPIEPKAIPANRRTTNKEKDKKRRTSLPKSLLPATPPPRQNPRKAHPGKHSSNATTKENNAALEHPVPDEQQPAPEHQLPIASRPGLANGQFGLARVRLELG